VNWLSYVLIAMVRLLVGAAPRYAASMSTQTLRIFFANHSSHIDTVALWSALPPPVRARTRPVAARDYWGRTGMRRFVALKALNAVLIDRNREDPAHDPLEPLMQALARGESLIIFPEGTRQAQALPGPFKAGLHRLADAFPDVELVPVYLENLHRSLPKGTLFPVPIICTVRFGTALPRVPGETRDHFLERARKAVTELA
jgi:1-acyl-sn-glycerol-3-phosphate acyltransferase